MSAGRSVSKCGTAARACRRKTSRSSFSRSSRRSQLAAAPASGSPSATASSTRTAARRAISGMNGAARRSSSSCPRRARAPTRRTVMTGRLYYADAYLREFDALVSRVERRAGGAAVFLDRTAFYPTSGGQPFDTGTIGDAERVAPQKDAPQKDVGRPFQGRLRVIDVVDEGDEIAHIVDGDQIVEGQPVRGVVDWTRRFDHMQQHTGQHVLSAAADRLFGARTVSFHLGTDAATIDLSRELTPQELVRAELDANRIVWENRPVTIRYASADEAAALPLRKESVREGTLRLIDVEDFDLSACGGTHVSTTGGIGVIAIGAVERFKGGQRVEFFCGSRALTKFRSMRDALAGAVRVLSVLPHELPHAIEKLQSEARDRQKTIAALQQD